MAKKETKSTKTIPKTGSVSYTLPYWDVKVDGKTYRYKGYIQAKTFAKNYVKAFPKEKVEIIKVTKY